MRLSRPVGPAGGVGDLCPGCGALLAPVGDLTEVVGFQAIVPREREAFDSVRVEAVPLPRPETT
jgi:hypothetical protein